MSGLKPHWLRPEETTKVIETMDETLTAHIKMVLQSLNQALSQEGGRKLSEEEIGDFVSLAKNKIPSNTSGKGLDPNVLQSLKLVMDMMKQKSQLDKKFGLDFLPRFQELALDAIRDNKSDQLNVAVRLIMKVLNKQINDKDFEQKYGKDFLLKFAELSLKYVNDPDGLSKEEKLQFRDMFKIVLGMVKADLEEKLTMKPTEQIQKELDDIKELSKQVEIWEGGVLVDIEEGVFAMGDKTKRSLSSILASAEVDPIELSFQERGIIHTLAHAIEGSDMVHPSEADKLNRGPTPPGVE